MTSAIAEYSKTEAGLAELREKYKDVRFDVQNVDGMKAAKLARMTLKELRVGLEHTRKEIKAPALERCQAIDTEARRISTALSALEDPIDKQIKDEEARIQWEKDAPIRAAAEAEAKRIADERAEIARQQAEIAAANAAREEQERLSRQRIEEEQRASRAKIEEEERAARKARDDADREARAQRDAEEAAAKAERDRLDAERRKLEEAQREQARKANEVLDARTMLATFVKRFGHLEEFSGVVAAINRTVPA